MTKSIASYKPEQRLAVVKRRLARPGHGNGYFAAVDVAKHYGIVVKGAATVRLVEGPNGSIQVQKDFGRRFNDKKTPLRRRPPMPHQNKPVFKKGR